MKNGKLHYIICKEKNINNIIKSKKKKMKCKNKNKEKTKEYDCKHLEKKYNCIIGDNDDKNENKIKQYIKGCENFSYPTEQHLYIMRIIQNEDELNYIFIDKDNITHAVRKDIYFKYKLNCDYFEFPSLYINEDKSKPFIKNVVKDKQKYYFFAKDVKKNNSTKIIKKYYAIKKSKLTDYFDINEDTHSYEFLYKKNARYKIHSERCIE